MPVHLEPSSAEDLDAIASLLTTAFDVAPDAAFVNRELLRWKYFEPFGDRSTPRSYVLEQDGDVVAHCVAWPLTLSVGGKGSGSALRTVCFADWAGSRRLPGAGSILLRKLMAQVPVAVVAGGSDATRQTIPRLGFTARDAIDVFARVVRPVRQARTRPRAGVVKDVARFARNVGWSLRPLGAVAPGWSARLVQSFARDLEQDPSDTAPAHPAEYLNYWLRCPAARVRGFEVYDDDEPAGWFVLSRVGRQTRIAGASLVRATPDRWQQLFRLAARAAADDPDTCEVVGTASTPATRAALAACGFEWRDTAPLFVFDKAGLLAGSTPLLWNAIDDDTAYLYDPSTPYRT